MSEIGLRERKKRRMYEAVSEVAIRLFLKKGFDDVSVAEVAAAAEISKPTLFRYFPAKEDLVLYRISDHEDEAARVVREAETAPVEALRRHFPCPPTPASPSSRRAWPRAWSTTTRSSWNRPPSRRPSRGARTGCMWH